MACTFPDTNDITFNATVSITGGEEIVTVSLSYNFSVNITFGFIALNSFWFSCALSLKHAGPPEVPRAATGRAGNRLALLVDQRLAFVVQAGTRWRAVEIFDLLVGQVRLGQHRPDRQPFGTKQHLSHSSGGI